MRIHSKHSNSVALLIATYLAKPAKLCAFASLLLLVPHRAEANGRYPEASQLVVGVTDPNRILVRATFGFLVSQNAGNDWRWVCEQAIGFNDVFDPPVALLQGETIIAGLLSGLSQSTDFGCGFVPVPATFDGKYVIDVTADRTAPQNGYAVATMLNGTMAEAFVLRTENAGATWALTGPSLGVGFNPVTIEVAPSNPNRVYVSGLLQTSTFEPVVAVSEDAGQSWTLRDNLGVPGPPYISAIDPDDEDRIYARVPGNDADAVYVSTDGATSFQLVVERPGRMLGFALSSDGSRIAIGGPSFGIESADAFDLEFSQRSPKGARCLTFDGAKLFVCGDEATDGFTVGVSTDEGATIAPLLTVAALLPIDCEPGASTCAPFWPDIQSLLGLDGATSSGTASTTTTGGGEDETDDGCGCETGGRDASRTPWIAAVGAAAAVLAARLLNRRRRSNRPSSA